MRWILSQESTVYRSVCNLTAVTVLAHMLLGCCWHHHHAFQLAPACTSGGMLLPQRGHVHASEDMAPGADCDNRSCGHEHGRPHQPDDRQHPDGDGCEDSRCMFVSRQWSRAPDASAGKCFDVTAATTTIDDGLSAGSHIRAGVSSAATRCPPLRTHLLEQVLLL